MHQLSLSIQYPVILLHSHTIHIYTRAYKALCQIASFFKSVGLLSAYSLVLISPASSSHHVRHRKDRADWTRVPAQWLLWRPRPQSSARGPRWSSRRRSWRGKGRVWCGTSLTLNCSLYGHSLLSNTGEKAAARLKLNKRGNKVLWPQPYDTPEDPQNVRNNSLCNALKLHCS